MSLLLSSTLEETDRRDLQFKVATLYGRLGVERSLVFYWRMSVLKNYGHDHRSSSGTELLTYVGLQERQRIKGFNLGADI